MGDAIDEFTGVGEEEDGREFVRSVAGGKRVIEGVGAMVCSIKTSLLSIREPVRECMERFNRTHEEIKGVERESKIVDREVENKKRACERLEEIIEKMSLGEEEVSSLVSLSPSAVGVLKKLEEIKGIGGLLGNMKGVLEKKKRVGKIEAALGEELQEFLTKRIMSVRKRMGREDGAKTMHESVGTYSEYIRWHRKSNPEKYRSLISSYSSLMKEIYSLKFNESSGALLNLLRKKARPPLSDIDNENLENQIRSSLISVVEVFCDLVEGEVRAMKEFAEEEREEEIERIFGDMPEKVGLFAKELAEIKDQQIPSFNLIEPIGELRREGDPQTLRLFGECKERILSLLENEKKDFLERMGRRIRQECKRGRVRMEETYFDVVNRCKVREVNSFIASLHLSSLSAIAEEEEIFSELKRAEILGSIEKHFLENREKYALGVEEEIEKEVDGICSRFPSLVEKRVSTEKPKRFEKRVEEIKGYLERVDGPLGLKLQVIFREGVLRKVTANRRPEKALF
jgi:Exocyst complex component Sec3